MLFYLRRLGGLGIINPIALQIAVKFPTSFYVTEYLQTVILTKKVNYSEEVRCSQFSCKLEIRTIKGCTLIFCVYRFTSTILHHLQKAVTLASEKGTSSWLCELPLQEYCFALHFMMISLCVMAGYQHECPLTLCVEVIFQLKMLYVSCPKRGYLSIRDSKVCDLTAKPLTDVHHDIKVEPNLHVAFEQ